MSLPPVTLRPARSEDAPRLGEIKRAAFDPEFLALTIWRSPLSWRYFEELAGMNDAGPPLLWIAEREETVVGYVHLVVLPGSWHLNDIAVAPEAQGQGIGAALFRHFETAATTMHRARLTLDVDQANHAAMRWYARRGFASREARTIVEQRHEDLLGLASPPLRNARFEGITEALEDERRRGFGRALLIGECELSHGTNPFVPIRREFGLVGGDAIRLPEEEGSEEECDFAIRSRFFGLRSIVLKSFPYALDPESLAQTGRVGRTIVRMERG